MIIDCPDTSFLPSLLAQKDVFMAAIGATASGATTAHVCFMVHQVGVEVLQDPRYAEFMAWFAQGGTEVRMALACLVSPLSAHRW